MSEQALPSFRLLLEEQEPRLGPCVLTGMRIGLLTNRRRRCASYRPTTEQAAAQESAFQGSVTVYASATEPRHLPGRINAG